MARTIPDPLLPCGFSRNYAGRLARVAAKKSVYGTSGLHRQHRCNHLNSAYSGVVQGASNANGSQLIDVVVRPDVLPATIFHCPALRPDDKITGQSVFSSPWGPTADAAAAHQP